MRDRDWIYIYNHLDGKWLVDPDKPTLELLQRYTVSFTLFDDDGELYLSGSMTAEFFDSHLLLEPLEYARDLWGCTEMKVKGQTI